MDRYEDDFEESQNEEQEQSQSNIVDSINDIKDTYDDIKDFSSKYKNSSSSQDTVNKLGQRTNNSVKNPNITNGATSSGTTATGATATGTAGTGAAATGAAGTGAAATGAAGTGAAATGAAGTGAAATGAAATGAAATGAAATGAAATGAAGTAAAGGAAVAGGPAGWVIAAAAILGNALKRENEKRKNETSEQKVKRRIKELAPLLIILAIVLLPVLMTMFVFSIGFTKTTYDSTERVNEFVSCIESNSSCEKITDIKLDEEIKGYNKDLILFKKNELQESSQEYAKFSGKNFKFGEGLNTDDYKDVKEIFGLSESYNLTSEELHSALLTTFFTLQARAFSKINWYEQYYDEKSQQIITKPIEEFDIIYDSSKDLNTKVDKWYSWIINGDINYVLKIPLVKKYSITKTDINIISDVTVTTVDDKEPVVTNGSNLGKQPTKYTPRHPDAVDDEYKKEIFEFYLGMVQTLLPNWFEIYSVYISTGDVETAKEMYNQYLEELNGGGKYKIEVYLYKEIADYRSVMVTTTDTETTVDGVVSNSHSVNTTVRDIREESYAAMAEKGAKWTAIRYNSSYKYGVKKDYEKKEPTIILPTRTGQGKSITDKGEEILHSFVTKGQKDETKKYRLSTGHDKDADWFEVCESYKDLLKLEKNNEYANTRLAYLYYLLCEDKHVKFDMDNIGAALEYCVNFYKNDGRGNSNIMGGTFKDDESVTPGSVDKVQGGWDSTYTSSSGKTYREYKQDLGYYKDKDYAGYGPFSSWACPMVATSIFLEGHGVYVDPYKLYQKTGALNPAEAANKYLGKGVAVSQTYNKQVTIDLLKSGNPVAIHNNRWNKEGHYMTILDYDEKTDRVYLSEVHTGFNGKTDNGWIDIDNIGIDTIYYMRK